MLAGSFGLAAVVKSRQPQVPLWALMLSTQLLGIIFLVLDALKIEGSTPVKGTNGGYGELVFSADYSHSLGGALGISIIAALVTAIVWGRRNALVIGAVVFSSWILDLLVHRSDLAILPGNSGGLPRLGLNLWSVPWLSAFVELCLALTGAFLYYHAAMRSAIRAERQDAKAAGKPVAQIGAQAGPTSYRQQALFTSVAMSVFLIATLVANYFLGN
ncbi:MAG: permease [Chloroflexota bacterium]|nr:permease [Chloroflexota bacterium]